MFSGCFLANIDRAKICRVSIRSEADLAEEIAWIANSAMELGYRLQEEDRILTKLEAYQGISHSTSFFKAILDHVRQP